MMRADMIYQYPIWAVALSLIAATVIVTILLEIGVRSFVSVDFRRQHNDIAAAILSIIGVTYAVLLAFVATVAWEGFNKAKAAAHLEAAVIEDVFDAASGFADPQRADLIDRLNRYTRTVIATEWPAQAQGHVDHSADAYLDELQKLALALQPSDTAQANFHALILQSLARLHDARQDRLLAAEVTVPAIVWIVLIAGGTITIAFSSFLGAPNVAMQVAMCGLLAVSGVLVLVLIIALSNPFRGDFRVSTAPFEYALSRIRG
jgi:hypothetical protein